MVVGPRKVLLEGRFMAQLPRAGGVGYASAVSASRMPAGLRNIASDGRGDIEEMSARTGVSFRDSSFLYQGYERESFAEDNGSGGNLPQQKRRLPVPGVFHAPSETFAIVFEAKNMEMGADQGGAVSRAHQNTLTKAISTYETNARVISGENLSLRGERLSIML